MTAKHHTNRHDSAATYHQRAAQFHRGASRHFEVGKDRQHWAHQAMAAHGHTLRAITCGHEDLKQHAPLEGPPSPKYPKIPFTSVRFYANAHETEENILQGIQWHAFAADHHEAAAHHYGEALRYNAEGDFDLAAEETRMANRHAQQSAFYSYEAVKQHFDRDAELDAASQDLVLWTKRKMIGIA